MGASESLQDTGAVLSMPAELRLVMCVLRFLSARRSTDVLMW